MKAQYTLYHYWRSTCSWRVRWALAHKGIPFESRVVNLLQGEQSRPEYLALNPKGTVPTLVADGKPLGESLAILEWLDEVHPEKPLFPKDPWERAWVRQFSLVIVAGTQPLQNLNVLRYRSEDEAERKKWAAHWIDHGLTACEKLLEGKSGKFAWKNELTAADLCLIPQLANADRFGAPTDKFPRLRAVREACLSLDSYRKAEPEAWKPA